MKVPVVWFCKKLKKVIRVDSDVVYSDDNGWICDCGNWIDGNDALHNILQFDNRDNIKELDFLYDVGISKLDNKGKCDCDIGKCHCVQKPLVLPVIGYRCVECGKHFHGRYSYDMANGDVTISDIRLKVNILGELLYGEHKFVIRSINGVWVCYDCYDYGGSA